METKKPQAEVEMDVLNGEPIKVMLCGTVREVLRMPLRKQQKAIGLMARVGKDGRSFGEWVTENYIDFVALATDTPLEELEKNSNLVEIALAYRLIWKQNGFDFLAETMQAQNVGELDEKTLKLAEKILGLS